MDKVITALFDGFAKLQAGKLMTAAGIIMLIMSGIQSIGTVELNPDEAESMQVGGLIVLFMGAYFSWYRAKQEAEDRRAEDMVKLHDRLARLEGRIDQYHGVDNG